MLEYFNNHFKFQLELGQARSKRLLHHIEERDREICRLSQLVRYLDITLEKERKEVD